MQGASSVGFVCWNGLYTLPELDLELLALFDLSTCKLESEDIDFGKGVPNTFESDACHCKQQHSLDCGLPPLTYPTNENLRNWDRTTALMILVILGNLTSRTMF